MSPTQWALLIVGAVAVIAIYWFSRRERPEARRRRSEAPVKTVKLPGAAPGAGNDQMDMFSRFGEFDEFGVGKPRKRVSPDLGGGTSAAGIGAAASAAAAPVEEKIVALLIAEREGTAIFGERIHAALQAQGLQFGDRKIYHRIAHGAPVFSVASLIKPGHLDPAQRREFSTPGLSVFMVLPGPTAPEEAIADMFLTARALARELNADVYDSNREPLTAAAEGAIVADVKAWARLQGL
ncbi:cell division protein ZipA C-terminal FtsZ-binding domain-containing protein [Sinimarinibacterium flocculans]|uniref:cell division protein ZipA C-terminal FtsZ-binding domain-containing protein n=1 Tax=Sinimarinibacterium flocculans TaxID=985250 RepID=UPI003513430F